jgi:excisionase family DNA binding protein
MDAMKELLEWQGLMTVKQAAQFLQIAPPHVRKLLGKGTILGYRVGGAWRISPSDLLVYLHDRRTL